MPHKKSLKLSKNWSIRIKAKIFLRRLKIILPVLVLLLIVIGLGFFLKSSFWNIKKVTCFEEENFCPTNLLIGKNLFFISLQDLRVQMLAKYPLIKQIIISKKIPNEIELRIKKREPLAALVKEGVKEYFLVDEDGVVLEKKDATNLPLIFINDSSAATVKAIKILWLLKLNLFEPKTVRVNSFNIEVILDKDIKAVFSSLKEIDPQINSLQLILNRAKIEGKNISRLDLRFDKPVVIYD